MSAIRARTFAFCAVECCEAGLYGIFTSIADVAGLIGIGFGGFDAGYRFDMLRLDVCIDRFNWKRGVQTEPNTAGQEVPD